MFVHLTKLKPGDVVKVTRSSAQVETFRITGSERAPKNAFPTADVNGSTPTPTLRLNTCDGVFNASIGHYLGNLIVFADLLS